MTEVVPGVDSSMVEVVPGVDNSICDTLSRFQFCRFRTLAPYTDQYPTTVTEEIWQFCLSK